jgi:uncharacterized membrane protein YphA (DoxX/SURF4 family)
MNKIEKFAIPVLCVTMGLVFLYFGFQQIYSPDNWATFVPDFLSIGAMTLNNWVMLNGVLELTLGLFLIMGLYTRFSALILSLHLLFIAFSIGFNPLGVRDFGLAIATFVIFLSGAHPYGIDAKVSNKSSHSGQTPSVQ